MAVFCLLCTGKKLAPKLMKSSLVNKALHQTSFRYNLQFFSKTLSTFDGNLRVISVISYMLIHVKKPLPALSFRHSKRKRSDQPKRSVSVNAPSRSPPLMSLNSRECCDQPHLLRKIYHSAMDLVVSMLPDIAASIAVKHAASNLPQSKST